MVMFTEVQFPADIAFGSTGGPSFSTDIIEMKNGYEQRNIAWDQPLLKFNIANGIKSKSDFESVKSFFYVQKGRAIGFRYKDWSDYQGVGEIIASGDGATTQFQLTKTYIIGASQTIRNVVKPVAGTVNIYLDGVLQLSGVSVDYITGLVTFSSAPASSVIISVDFEFDVPVRFDTDYLSVAVESNNLFETGEISLIEVRA